METILISDAAKQVEVESHVLRYWEEELHLPIQRNKQGHRYYTTEDVNRFKQIKTMKEQGFQLKAIRNALDGKLPGIGTGGAAGIASEGGPGEPTQKPKELTQEPKELSKKSKNQVHRTKEQAAKVSGQAPKQPSPETMVVVVPQEQSLEQQEKAGKAARLQFLLQHMIAEAVRENNEELCENVKQTVAKEMDFQFRQQEEKDQERETERLKREEEHYRKLDLLLRGKNSRENRKETRKEKRKKAFLLQKQMEQQSQAETKAQDRTD